VTRSNDVKAALQTAVDRFGRLDLAFNNAGIEQPLKPTAEVSEDEWDRIVDISLRAVFVCMKHEIPLMLRQGGGAIVKASSGAGVRSLSDGWARRSPPPSSGCARTRPRSSSGTPWSSTAARRRSGLSPDTPRNAGPRGARPPTQPPEGAPDVQITRSSIDTQKGPADWFTGDVYIDAVAAREATSTFAAAGVHFAPGARTAWHTHPHGQTIFVTEGVGLCQREVGPIEVIRPGDRVFFEPGENHWHGAAPNRFMVHIAMQQNDESGSPVYWGEHVTEEQYGAARAGEA
jgi:quercetin dioxygenase-like cupin family protein